MVKFKFASYGNGTCRITGYEGFAPDDLVLPSTSPDGDRVTRIGPGAFQKDYFLVNVTLPSSVTSIGAAAFRGCPNLEKVTIPDSVTEISWEAFSYCPKLKHLRLP